MLNTQVRKGGNTGQIERGRANARPRPPVSNGSDHNPLDPVGTLDPRPDPTDPDDPTITDWEGVWPDGGLLRDGGKVWRNVSGVPLTTPPSGFPGQPSQWGHLFVTVLTAPEPEPEPEPTRPVGYVGEWSASARYEVGDVVSHSGRYWKCLVGHGAEYQGTWAPGVAHAAWADIGPA